MSDYYDEFTTWAAQFGGVPSHRRRGHPPLPPLSIPPPFPVPARKALISYTKGSMESGDELGAETLDKIVHDHDSFLREHGTEIINIYVGPEKVHFAFHKALICGKAPFFAKMFQGSFKEAADGVAYLPEDNPEAFDIFSMWVYQSNFPPGIKVHKLFKGFYLAEKYCMERFMDCLMDTAREECRRRHELPDGELVREIYQNTEKGSRLRRFILDILIFVMLDEDTSYPELWPTTQICDIVSDCEDLMLDIFRSLRQKASTGHLVLQGDPIDGPDCEYHQHMLGEPCPQLEANRRARSNSLVSGNLEGGSQNLKPNDSAGKPSKVVVLKYAKARPAIANGSYPI